jgi:hypothetical protein
MQELLFSHATIAFFMLERREHISCIEALISPPNMWT